MRANAGVDPSHGGEVGRALLSHLQRETFWSGASYAHAPTRIFGGNQSFVYGLELAGTPLRGPLILRILRSFLPQDSVEREAAVQNTLRDLGYPTAAVGYACPDPSVLGGAFMLMERLPGTPIVGADANGDGSIGLRRALKDFRAFVFGPWPVLLAELQHRLHTLPVDRIRSRLAERGVEPGTLSFARSLERLAARADEVEIDGLASAIGWLRDRQHELDHRPLAFCHGDFFPNQILGLNGRVTGVIDWTDACFAPAEVDVVEVKVGIETLPVPLGAPGRRIVAARAQRFHRAYDARSPLPNPEVSRYVEALRCTRSLLALAERRRALRADSTRTNSPNPYDDPRSIALLERRVVDITGCSIRLRSGPS